MLFFVILCSLSCVLLVLSERAGSSARIALFKVVASSAFVGAALVPGVPADGYGLFVLLALAFSWLGDVLLIPRSHPRIFLAGMASFLLAHFSYCLAFWFHGPNLYAFVMAVPIVGAAAYLVSRWLRPHLSGAFRVAVPAYIAAITAMILLAASAGGKAFGLQIASGAVLFAASDIIVARDRFVQNHWRNRAIGLPLYYAAQLVLASTLLR